MRKPVDKAQDPLPNMLILLIGTFEQLREERPLVRAGGDEAINTVLVKEVHPVLCYSFTCKEYQAVKRVKDNVKRGIGGVGQRTILRRQ